MLLRPRQKTMLDNAIAALNTHNNTLCVAPTGFGKGVAIAAIAGESLKNGASNALVIQHRDELVTQNRERFTLLHPEYNSSVVNAQEKDWTGKVVFGMVQTLAGNNAIAAMPAFDLVIIDECHHVVAGSYLKILGLLRSKNPSVKICGLTATAMRGDKKGLREVFNNIADQITLEELIRSGHLVPPRTFVVNVGTQEQLRGVKRIASDFDMGEVEEIMDKTIVNDAVVKHWKEKAGDRKTIVFCSTIRHAQHVCTAFIEAGVKAAVIDSNLSRKERENIIHDFNYGDLQVLLNCFVLTEGFDSQPVSCIVLLRPSSYKSTFIQCIGRGLRTVDPAKFPGVIKTDCVVLDFGTSSLLHGTLEQDINLEIKKTDREAPKKICPECNAKVPASVKECSLCGYEWPKEKFGSSDNNNQLANFIMSEIDLLKRSSFKWCDLFSDDTALIAHGFHAWGGIFFLEGRWYALGGTKTIRTRLLAIGERTVCLAAADDWLNEHETSESAHKSKRWLKQPATDRQIKCLPEEIKRNRKLTRYQASTLIKFVSQKPAIIKIVFGAMEAA